MKMKSFLPRFSHLVMIGMLLISDFAFAKPEENPDDRPWEKAGFRAVVGSVEQPGQEILIKETDKGLLFFVTTDDGLMSHACDTLQASPYKTSVDGCSLMLGKGITIQPKDLMDTTNGFKAGLLLVLKAIGGVAVQGAASASSFGHYSEAAAAVNAIVAPDPIPSTREKRKDAKVMKEIVKEAKVAKDKNDPGIITRHVPGIFDDGQGMLPMDGLRWSMATLLNGIFGKKVGKPEGEAMEYEYTKFIRCIDNPKLVTLDKAGNQVACPAPPAADNGSATTDGTDKTVPAAPVVPAGASPSVVANPAS